MSRLATGSLVLALIAGSAPVVRLASGGDAPKGASVELSGRWTYNVDASDDAREKMRAGMGRPVGPGGGSGGGYGGGVGGPGGAAGGPGRGGPPRMGGGDEPSEEMRAILDPAEELAITQSGSEITVEEKFARLRRLHADGKKYKTDNGSAEIKAWWKEGRLLVETTREHGSTVTEAWERVPDGSRLIVNLRVEGGPGGKLELKRVYDKAAAQAETTPR
jgi:hypothetical protein